MPLIQLATGIVLASEQPQVDEPSGFFGVLADGAYVVHRDLRGWR